MLNVVNGKYLQILKVQSLPLFAQFSAIPNFCDALWFKCCPGCISEANRRSVKRTSQTWCYRDDILLWANTKEEVFENILKTFDLCHKVGIRLNLAKYKFCVQEVKYFGHTSQNGISPDPDKIKSIREMQTPTSKKELQILSRHGELSEKIFSKFVGNYIKTTLFAQI